jgi:hypothetical protein
MPASGTACSGCGVGGYVVITLRIKSMIFDRHLVTAVVDNAKR